MDLVALLNGLIANITALQLQLVDSQVAAQALADSKYAEGVSSRDLEVEGLKAKIAELEAAIPNGKSYSQEELDAAVAAAVGPLSEQIASLQAQIDVVPSVIEMKVSEAVLAFKADLKAKYELQQVAETEGEVGFKAFLE